MEAFAVLLNRGRSQLKDPVQTRVIAPVEGGIGQRGAPGVDHIAGLLGDLRHDRPQGRCQPGFPDLVERVPLDAVSAVLEDLPGRVRQ